MSTHLLTAVKTEGGLLPQDLLSRVQNGDASLAGTKAETYHLGPHERIGEAVNRSWSKLSATWQAFQAALEKEPEGSLATRTTRERWLLPLFQELGFGRLPKGTALTVDGRTFAVSHTWDHTPIHLLGIGVDLDRRQKGVAGAASSSPHGLVQDFLNRSDDHLWGFLSNGYQLRVLRDHHSLTRQAYVEFDLQAIMEGEQYSEFLLLWLVCHQSRVELPDREGAKPEDCWLETWVNTSRDEGVRALDKLRDGVEKAIEAFGTGFLAHRGNAKLKDALESGELDKQEYYRQVLRLVYRLIFIFVAEERDALLDPSAEETARDRYRRFYSTRRIRDLSDRKRGGPHGDLWRGLALVMEKLDDGEPTLGLPALGSALWGPNACPWLMDADCANEHVLNAFRQLSHIQDGKTRYPVNWRNVGADELGSIYEGLLELHPRMNKEAGTFELDTAAGHERKTTGSYYTPTSLVDCLLDSALDPVLDEACKKPDPEQAVLDLKVCDPACGSGHFLVAAARRIAKRLASVRSGDDEPSPRDVQKALRDVVGRCIYGVDLNPMAVELCKVSLWMEAIEPGRPLSFLDSHIQCGNALLGTTPALMSRGIPNDAFKPIEGDDKEVAKRLKKRNRDEIKGQTSLLGLLSGASGDDYAAVAGKAQAVDRADDADIGAVRQKAERWSQLSHSAEYKDAWFRADAWCAAFVWPKQEGQLENAAITHDTWRRIEKDVSAAGQVAKKTVRDLAKDYRFFHWHLAFPQVFGGTKSKIETDDTTGWTGGFDCMLGNPPWERVNFQDKEWFAGRSPEIASAKNAAARRRLVGDLKSTDPDLYRRYVSARRHTIGMASFCRFSKLYPLTGQGDINTYSAFAEVSRNTLGERSRFGLVLPTGIATDRTTRFFFQDLMSKGALEALYSFENEEFIFPTVHHATKFCLMTVTGSGLKSAQAEFSFYLRRVDQLKEPERRFWLDQSDIERINPNTRTCPTFRTAMDAEILKAMHSSAPILVRDTPLRNPWSVILKRMFHMGDDSHLFVPAQGAGDDQERGGSDLVPLIEAKMVHQYDHRFGTYKGQSEKQRRQGKLPECSEFDHRDPFFTTMPRYMVSQSEVASWYSDLWENDWVIGWRDVTSAVSKRTAIFSVVPAAAFGHTFPLLFLAEPLIPMVPALLANLNSIPLDYAVRQVLGGNHLTYTYLRQLPVFPPDYFRGRWLFDQRLSRCDWLTARVLELSYTSTDLASFAHAVGIEGAPWVWNNSRRSRLQAEIDAAFFHAYELHREQVQHILDSFWIVRDAELKTHGDYRTKLQILEIYDAMQRAIDTGEPYQTLLDPPPADPRCAHPESTRPDWAKEG